MLMNRVILNLFAVLALLAFTCDGTTISENSTVTGAECDHSTCISGFVCFDDMCRFCASDAECRARSAVLRCSLDAIEFGDYGRGHVCEHKTLFPIHFTDVLVIIVLFTGAALAAGGGLGGGGMFVPILILVASFSAKDAVPLSNACIVGLAVGNCIQFGRRRHPNADRPLIDYRLAMLMLPSVLLGSIIGVLLNDMFPDWLVLVILLIVLGFTTYRTFKKTMKVHRKEVRDKKEKEEAALEAGDVEDVDNNDNDDNDDVTKVSSSKGKQEGKKKKKKMKKKNKKVDVDDDDEEEVEEGDDDDDDDDHHDHGPQGRKGDINLRPLHSNNNNNYNNQNSDDSSSSTSMRQSRRRSSRSRRRHRRRHLLPLQINQDDDEDYLIPPPAPPFDSWLQSRMSRLRRAQQREELNVMTRSIRPVDFHQQELQHHSSRLGGSRRSQDWSDATTAITAAATTTTTATLGANVPRDIAKLIEDERRIPWRFVGLISLLLFILVVLSLLKGSSRGTSIVGVHPCSAAYWILLWAVAPLCILLALYAIRVLLHMHKLKLNAPANTYVFAPGDVQWTRGKAAFGASISLLAGAAASLIGIGGGLVLGPIMLELHVNPQVMAATSSVMILFTSLSSAAQYMVLGRLPWDYGIVLALAGFVSSLVGVNLLGYFVRKYKKQSLIAMIIGLVLVISMVLLIIIGAINIAEAVKTNDTNRLSFSGTC